jgi:anaerobic magnesium-protoporphyrin IX monomethyl ester cyclase
MRVLFVYPDFLSHRSDWPGYFYSGIAQLSAVLKLRGNQTRLVHIVQPIQDQDFVSQVKAFDPQIICFSGASNYIESIARFSKLLVDAGINTLQVLGGIHATICPEKCLAIEGLNIVCRGEGENPLAELCDAIENHLDISGIQNLWIKRDGKILQNPLRPPVASLDSLPFLDRGIFTNYLGLYLERTGLISMMASRGCPFNCSYCSNKALRATLYTQQHGIRFRSPRHVVDEILQVRQTYPTLDKVAFDDDILFFSEEWAGNFTELYLREVRLPFICNGRPNLLKEDTIKLLRKAGCYHLKIGLESGNEYISNRILNRGIMNDQIRAAFRLARQYGIHTESFNMVGLPEETPERVLDTIKLNAEIKTNSMQVTIFQAYPGTDLYAYCKTKGYLSEDEKVLNFFEGSTLSLTGITTSQVLMFRNFFKVFTFIYRIAYGLKVFRDPFTKLLDKFLCFKPTSYFFNLSYRPLNAAFRHLQCRKYSPPRAVHPA